MIWICAVQFATTSLLLCLFQPVARRVGLVDMPNRRSSHYQATPRGGGIVFYLVWLSFCLGIAVSQQVHASLVLSLASCAAVVGFIGFVDDLRGVASIIRFGVHASVALAFLLINREMLPVPFQPLIIAALCFAIVWSINLFNFMDGIDGIAAFEALVVLGMGGVCALIFGADLIADLSFSLIACLAAFLFFNFPRARVFMGDVGSGFLGFIIAALAIISHYLYGVPLWAWILAYSIFITDSTFTLLRRVVRGEKWYAAHKSHAYQRLHHVARWSHLRINVLVLTLNAVLLSLIWIVIHGILPLYVCLAGAVVVNGAYLLICERRAPFA